MPVPEFEIIARHGAVELNRYTVIPGQFTIGRASASSISVKVGAVSRTHVLLTVHEDGTVFVEDLGSANGTILDGDPITGTVIWEPGKPLGVGDVTLELLPIPATRPPEEYSPTLSPSQLGEAVTPQTPITPASPGPIQGIGIPRAGATEAEVIRNRLTLVSREAQRIDVEKEIARGGMGAVLAARESATHRTVAMKVMLRGDDAKGAARFIEEAQVTAQLEHPNIVPVYDLSVDEQGQPFYTMKLVSGITLKKVLELIREGRRETIARYPLGTLLTVFQKVCDAIAFSHSRGVIHRDLKPANIMLGKYGEVLVMDWGLAKIVGKNASVEKAVPGAEADIVGWRGEEGDGFSTMAGSVMGTPQYMSPEQGRGENDSLDARSDIFTLGVILYEILVLERPFSGRKVNEILAKIVEGKYLPPLERIASYSTDSGNGGGHPQLAHLPAGRIPESLDAIVRKAMQLDRSRRYKSVPELQGDLTAYQNGFATSAEDKTAWRQLKLFVSRNRKVVTAAAAGILLLAISSSVFTWRVVRERDRAEAGELAAKRQTRIAELNSKAAQVVNLAQSAPEEALGRAMLAVEESQSLLGAVTPAVQYGLSTALERYRRLEPYKGTVGRTLQLVLSETSGRLARFGENNDIEVREMATQQPVARIKHGTAAPLAAAFSDDGGLVAACDGTRSIIGWELPDTKHQWDAHPDGVQSVAFVPGTRKLISISTKGEVKTWSAPGVASGEAWKIELPGGQVDLAAFGGGTRVVGVSVPGALSVDAYCVQLGEPGKAPAVVPLRGHSARISAITVSSDGSKLATADSDGLVRVWSPSGTLLGGPFSAQRGPVYNLAFSHAGDLLAASGMERIAAVFSLNGTLIHGPFELDSSAKQGVAITRDGELVAAGGARFDLLGLESDPAVFVESSIEDMVLSPDGSKLGFLDVDGAFQVMDLASRTIGARRRVVSGRGKHLAISPDGSWIACAALADREVRIVDWAGKEAAQPYRLREKESLNSLQVFPATGWIAIGTNQGRVIFHDPRGGGREEVFDFQPPRGAKNIVTILAASPQGLAARATWVLSAQSGRVVRFDNERRVKFDKPTSASSWFVWSDLPYVLLGPEPRVLVPARTNAAIYSLRPEADLSPQMLSLSSSQNVKAIASVGAESFGVGDEGGSVRFFTLQGEALTPWIRRDIGSVRSVVPLADGGRVATGAGDGRIRFWDYGVERWMRSAARRLGDAARVNQPETDADRALAKLVARHRPPPRARIVVSQPAPLSPSAITNRPKAAIPDGLTPIAGTPLAWAIPEGWSAVPQNQLAMVSRLVSAMFVSQRAKEIDIVAGITLAGTDLRAALADSSVPGVQMVRMNNVRRPEELARAANETLSMMRGAMSSGQMSQLVAGSKITFAKESDFIARWDEGQNTATWYLEGTLGNGQRAVFRGIVIPTREDCYLVTMRASGESIEKVEQLFDDLCQGLHIPPELRVDDSYRSTLRGIILDRVKTLDDATMAKQKSDEFGRIRDQANRAIDGGQVEEGIKLGERALALAEELESLEPASRARWMLHGANLYQELYRRMHYKGKGALMVEHAERGVAKAKAAMAGLGNEEARTSLGRNHRALGDALRLSKRPAEAVREYGMALDLLEHPFPEKVSAIRVEAGIECALEWAKLERATTKSDVGEAQLARALKLQRLLIQALPGDRHIVRILFDDAHHTTEVVHLVRKSGPAAEHLKELLSLLDAQLSRKDLDASTFLTLGRFTARVQSLVQRQKEPFYPAKDLAARTIVWLDRLEQTRPLTAEEAGWRNTAKGLIP